MIRLAALILIYAIIAKPAYAYIDAALGSLVLQGVAAGFFTFMMFWRRWMQRVKNFFRRSRAEETGPASGE